jgi:hypothetical protein
LRKRDEELPRNDPAMGFIQNGFGQLLNPCLVLGVSYGFKCLEVANLNPSPGITPGFWL